MHNTKQNVSIRWFYLAVGVTAMLFAGILYAWSILKSPFSVEYGWSASELALNFTLAMCLTGISYGACPTITAAFTSAFYGMKHYSTNMAFMTFTSMSASLIATVSSRILEISGGYTAPFLMLLALAVAALFINLFIRKP